MPVCRLFAGKNVTSRSPALGRLQEPGNHAKQRGFTATRRSEQEEELSRLDRQVNAADSGHRPVPLHQPVHSNLRHEVRSIRCGRAVRPQLVICGRWPAAARSRGCPAMVDSMRGMTSPAAHHVNRLRTWRVRGRRTTTMADVVPGMQRSLRRAERQVGAFADAWHQCTPPPLRDQCRVESMRGGAARITAGSAAVAFQLDRALRSGLLRALRSTCSTAIARVDVRVGSLHQPPQR